MIRRFPYEAAFLARTKLRYVNLPSILSDGKVDRSARVPAFVAIYLGTETGIIFLQDGEPVAAALVRVDERRPASVADVIQRGQLDSERAEAGYYRVAAGQLNAMWASVACAPQAEAEPPQLASTRALLEWVRECAPSAALEVLAGDGVAYLLSAGGTVAEAWLPGRAVSSGLPELRDLLARPAGASVSARAFPLLECIPPQATPALFALYERTAGVALDVGAGALGAEAAARTLELARERVGVRHPLLAAFQVEDGRVRAHAMVGGADDLTSAVAAWLFEAVTTTAHASQDEPTDLMRRITGDQRYALKAQGFFSRLPWPLAF